MNVYVVSYGFSYEDSYILGVFSSEEKAKLASVDQGLYETYDYVTIEECKIDDIK